jgi:hypothetical protein
MTTTDAVRRLAQYRPFEREGRDTRGAVRDLILASAIENGSVIESLGSCRETCQVLWGLEVEIDEIRSNVRELVEAGQLVPEQGGYRIADAASIEIAATLSASAETEEQAFHEWELTIKSVTPGLSEEDVSELRADLELWLRQLIRRHGLEAALILYPESSDGAEMLKRLEGEGLNFLPRRSPEIEAVRERAFFLFVSQPTEKQRTLLANLMNTAYFLTVLTLDPEAKQLVQDVARGQSCLSRHEHSVSHPQPQHPEVIPLCSAPLGTDD